MAALEEMDEYIRKRRGGRRAEPSSVTDATAGTIGGRGSGGGGVGGRGGGYGSDRFRSTLHIYISNTSIKPCHCNAMHKDQKLPYAPQNETGSRTFCLYCGTSRDKCFPSHSNMADSHPPGISTNQSKTIAHSSSSRKAKNTHSMCRNTLRHINEVESFTLSPAKVSANPIRANNNNNNDNNDNNNLHQEFPLLCWKAPNDKNNNEYDSCNMVLHKVRESVELLVNANRGVDTVCSSLQYADHRRYRNQVLVQPGLSPVAFTETDFHVLNNSHRRFKSRLTLKNKNFKTTKHLATLFVSPKVPCTHYVTTVKHSISQPCSWHQTVLELQPKRIRSVCHIVLTGSRKRNPQPSCYSQPRILPSNSLNSHDKTKKIPVYNSRGEIICLSSCNENLAHNSVVNKKAKLRDKDAVIEKEKDRSVKEYDRGCYDSDTHDDNGGGQCPPRHKVIVTSLFSAKKEEDYSPQAHYPRHRYYSLQQHALTNAHGESMKDVI